MVVQYDFLLGAGVEGLCFSHTMAFRAVNGKCQSLAGSDRLFVIVGHDRDKIVRNVHK